VSQIDEANWKLDHIGTKGDLNSIKLSNNNGNDIVRALMFTLLFSEHVGKIGL